MPRNSTLESRIDGRSERPGAGSAGDRPRVDYSGAAPHPADEMIERLAWLMDNSIPIGGGYRIGLDPLLGLVPGLGDMLGAFISGAIIVQAHRAGVPRPTIARMLANVAIDSAVGAIPLAGDFFDATWKANTKNLELYRSARTGRHGSAGDVLFVAAILLVLAAVVAIPVVLAWMAWHYLIAPR